MRAKENVTKSMTVPDEGSICGTENPGRCHSAHRLPRMRPPNKVSADGRAETSNDARAPARRKVPSAMTAGRPKRTNRYYRKPTRHRTIRRSRRPMPAHTSVAPVTMRAAMEGPSRLAGGLVALRARYGRGGYRLTHVSPTYCGVAERTIAVG